MIPPKPLCYWFPVDPDRFHRWPVALFIAFLVVIADQGTKMLALHFLPANGKPQPFLGNFITLHLTHNSGAALSLGNEKTLLVSVLSLIILMIVTAVMLLTSSRAWAYSLALIVGGGYGNLIDRGEGHPWGTGAVTDFIDYFGFFVGNVADIFVVIGVILVFRLLSQGTPIFGYKTSDDTEETVKTPLAPHESAAEEGK